MDSTAKTNLLLFLTLMVLGTALDLGTKSWIFDRLGFPPNDTIVLWPRVFSLTTNLNYGALFGMGQGFSLGFAALSIVAAAGVGYWLFGLGGIKDRWLVIALGLVSGGILGNLYDRLGFPGLKHTPFTILNHPAEINEPIYAVRDWLHFCIRSADQQVIFDWPVFNLADCFLVIGAGIMFLLSFRKDKNSNIKNP